jgi:flavin-dependent dehydrogenase
MNTTEPYDAIIIGGGPAGSTAATVLAGYGHRILVIEKECFPRYHVGESLVPFCYFTLERLGMLDKLGRSGFVRKYSVQFAGADGRISQPFYFSHHMDHPASQTWQVLRSEFDKMLLDNSRGHGASVLEETSVKKLVLENGRVSGVETENQRTGVKQVHHAQVIIDASGRDAFSIARHAWRERDPELNKISLWTYFRGASRDPGIDEGATTIAYLPEKGWFWYIPLADDLTSVGIVAERDYLYENTRDPAEIMCKEIGKNLWIRDHLAHAEHMGPYRVTGDFSYRSRYCAADGLVLTGDALAFLDPVFSSGVFLALRGGELAGEAVHDALEVGDTSATRFEEYGRTVFEGMEAMRKLVYAFYDRAFSFGKVLRKYPDMHFDLTDCLIGNLFRDFDALFRAVGEFAAIPEPLAYGKPLVRSS